MDAYNIGKNSSIPFLAWSDSSFVSSCYHFFLVWRQPRVDPSESRQFAFDSTHHVGMHRLPLHTGLSRNGGDLPTIGQRCPHQRVTGTRHIVERQFAMCQSIGRLFLELKTVKTIC